MTDIKMDLGFEDVEDVDLIDMNGDGVIDDADVLLMFQGGVACDGKGDD